MKDTGQAAGMEMFETTHTSLLEAAKNGNLTAAKWERFGVRYWPVLVRYAEVFYKMPHDLAENAVQETILQMWLNTNLIYRPPNGKFRYVLVAVLRFKFLEAMKSENKHQEQPDPADLPWLQAERDELKEATLRAFFEYAGSCFKELIESGNWPDCGVDNTALEQWYSFTFEDRTQDEIAAEYGTTQATVSRHINSVMDYLAKEGERIIGRFGIA